MGKEFLKNCELENGDACAALGGCFFELHLKHQETDGGEKNDLSPGAKKNGPIFQQAEWDRFSHDLLSIARETGCARIPFLETNIAATSQKKKDTDELIPNKSMIMEIQVLYSGAHAATD